MNSLVREMDSRWNQISASLYLMHSKLANLGFVRRDGSVVVVGNGHPEVREIQPTVET